MHYASPVGDHEVVALNQELRSTPWASCNKFAENLTTFQFQHAQTTSSLSLPNSIISTDSGGEFMVSNFREILVICTASGAILNMAAVVISLAWGKLEQAAYIIVIQS